MGVRAGGATGDLRGEDRLLARLEDDPRAVSSKLSLRRRLAKAESSSVGVERAADADMGGAGDVGGEMSKSMTDSARASDCDVNSSAPRVAVARLYEA